MLSDESLPLGMVSYACFGIRINAARCAWAA